MRELPDINIVIPIYNRPIHTKQSIDSLYENTDRDFNLLVIDDLSDLETRDVIRDLQKNYGFQLLRNGENLGPGASRNKAMDFITKMDERGKYLYNCDNDVYYTKGWLNKLIEAYEYVSTKGVGLLGGGCHPYLQNNATISLPDKADYVGIKDAVSGYSHLITWELWDRFGPFETQENMDKKTGRSDDWKFCQDMKEQNFMVGSLYPEVVIATGKTDSYGDKAIGQETFKKLADVYIK